MTDVLTKEQRHKCRNGDSVYPDIRSGACDELRAQPSGLLCA